jgi:hypothetical protein
MIERVGGVEAGSQNVFTIVGVKRVNAGGGEKRGDWLSKDREARSIDISVRRSCPYSMARERGALCRGCRKNRVSSRSFRVRVLAVYRTFRL